jgi:acyl-CoA thioesterase
MEHSFFQFDGELLRPTALARGPWGNDTLHGRVVAGLFARCIECEYGDEDFQFARLTVDLFRMATMYPLSISVDRVRQGRRISVCHAVAISEGREVARASAVQPRRGESPPGKVWQPDPWGVPPPDALEPKKSEGTWVPMWETRSIAGDGFVGSGQKRMWIRETHALVAGEGLTPFIRVASAADIASPLSMSGDAGLAYVNADISLYLHRLPLGEWIGWEVCDQGSAAGVGQGECRVYDEKGPIGKSIVCAVANSRSIG